MKIELAISTQNLGENTAAGNERYAAAVKREIQAQYPDADVSVNLVTNVDTDFCRVSDDPTGEYEEIVRETAKWVWDRADY